MIPLVGSGRAEHVERNLEALEVQLDADELALLDRALPVGAPAGAPRATWRAWSCKPRPRPASSTSTDGSRSAAQRSAGCGASGRGGRVAPATR